MFTVFSYVRYPYGMMDTRVVINILFALSLCRSLSPSNAPPLLLSPPNLLGSMCKKRSFCERVQHQRLRQWGQLEERQLCTWTKRLNTEGSNQSWWVVHNIHAHSHSKRKRKFKYARCTVRENTRTLNTEHRTRYPFQSQHTTHTRSSYLHTHQI